VATVGFVLKPDAADARSLLGDLVTWLDREGHRAVVTTEDQVAPEGAEIVPEVEMAGGQLDLLVVLGGDGTMLRASRVVDDSGVPVLGINLGQLGFLAGFAPDEARGTLAAALSGELRLEERSRLAVVLQRRDGEPVSRKALNDAVIHQGAMARIVDVQAWIDGAYVGAYRADGLIVATPTGSTAYNMAAGGPILIPGAAGMTLTPICAHSLTNRPLVVPASSTIRFELGTESRGVVLTIDGQWAHSFLPGDQVAVTAASRPLRLYAGPKSYFDVMKDKLHWGLRGAR
jgi:NAD+ kinase